MRPAPAHLLDVGQGMSATLRVASERAAYTLTDRATFLQLERTIGLRIQFEGGSDLLNTYAVFRRAGITGERRGLVEGWLAWMTTGDGRSRIAAFRVAGAPLFHVWPAARPRQLPTDLPY